MQDEAMEQQQLDVIAERVARDVLCPRHRRGDRRWRRRVFHREVGELRALPVCERSDRVGGHVRERGRDRIEWEKRLLQFLDRAQVDSNSTAEPNKKGLSAREHAVLKMVAAGYTSAEVGLRLTISGLTVNTHIKNIYRKLQVKTRAHAVSSALQRGLL